MLCELEGFYYDLYNEKASASKASPPDPHQGALPPEPPGVAASWIYLPPLTICTGAPSPCPAEDDDACYSWTEMFLCHVIEISISLNSSSSPFICKIVLVHYSSHPIMPMIAFLWLIRNKSRSFIVELLNLIKLL